MPDNQPPLYERQSWDTPTSWALFQIYLLQDYPRSLLRAYLTYKGGKKEAKKGYQVPGSILNLSQGKNRDGSERPGAVPFTKRVEAYEDHLAREERAAWVRRRRQLRENEWKLSEELIAKAKDMLLFPVMVQETVLDEEGTHQVIMPAGWSFKDIPGMLNTASKIARLAADMPTKQVKFDWRTEAAKDGFDPDELQARLVAEILSRMDGGGDSRSDAEGEADTEGEGSPESPSSEV